MTRVASLVVAVFMVTPPSAGSCPLDGRSCVIVIVTSVVAAWL
jgi:hypothetical protein